ncbi:MAG: glycoside hydrolase family 38 C-terminal domain-containing protein [Candidatus Zhuqueibacterota bacterium]
MVKKQVHVISHTHWDREWYMTFQQYRLKLVDLIDTLLDLLEKNSDYRYFHLDGQTVVLDDYFEIRPENRPRLESLVRQGRVLIGPWYVLCDEFLVSGESIVRNLLLGHAMAGALGKVMKVGYVIDAFGHISQMPQIFANFEIDNAIMWRGVGGPDFKSEFYWRSPDGSTVLTYKVQDVGGYCYGVFLPSEPEALQQRLAAILQERQRHATTDHLVVMNGCDHIEPQPNLPAIIELANQIEPDANIFHSTIPELFARLKEDVKGIPMLKGELRDNQHVNLLAGTISSRMYLKKANNDSQTLLERFVEPLAAIAWTLSGRYPQAQIWQSWKYLMQNQPHDDICGCSVDAVHEQMQTRFAWSREIAHDLIDRSFYTIFNTPDLNALDARQADIILFNPLGWKRSEVVTGRADFPADTEIFSIAVSSADAATVPCQVESIRVVEKLQVDPRFGPMSVMVKQVTFSFLAENIPSCGYKLYHVIPAADLAEPATDLVVENFSAENTFLKIRFRPEGTFDVLNKTTSQTYSNCNLFEDGGDSGDEYTYSFPMKDRLIYGFETPPQISIEQQGPVKAVFMIKGNLKLPESLNPDFQSRSDAEVTCPVISRVAIHSKTRYIQISTEIDNRAKDHRLRVLFPSQIRAEFSFAGGNFDVISRKIALPPRKGWMEDPIPTHPFQHFVSINDAGRGLTIASPDVTEFEVKRTPESPIALTLLRCVGSLARFDLMTRKGRDGWRFKTPGGQCPGVHQFSYAIIPHAGNWLSDESHTLAFNNSTPMLTKQIRKKPEQLPETGAFLTVQPAELVLSCLKRSEHNDAIIIRMYNISNRDVAGRIHFFQRISTARIVTMAEEPVSHGELVIDNNHTLSVNFPGNKILTIELFIAETELRKEEFFPPIHKIMEMQG